jgi:Bax protein
MSGVLSLGLSLTGQYLRFLAVCLLFAVFSGCSQTGQVSTPSSSPKQKLAAAPSLNAPTPRSTQFNPLPLPLRIVYPIRYDQGIERKGEILAVSNSAEEIARIFKKEKYEVQAVRNGTPVPPIFVDRIPFDLRQRSIKEKKELFFKMVLPMALVVNLEIREIRARIEASGCRGATYQCTQPWLRELGENYRVDTVDQLLTKIDEIPPSLMLAQAVEESGWGSSRFSQDGNALFGQRTWDSQDSGMIPYERENGANYRVRAFNDIIESLRVYSRNLNRHKAYTELRRRRAGFKHSGQRADSYSLIKGLTKYSTTGDAYVKNLRSIIEKNRLQDFDRARLDLNRQPKRVLVSTY